MMKNITQERYVHAMALYIIARKKQVEVDNLELELNALLSQESNNHVSDAIYCYRNTGTQREFDKCLSLMDIGVVPKDGE